MICAGLFGTLWRSGDFMMMVFDEEKGES